jgi:hypothetical protein
VEGFSQKKTSGDWNDPFITLFLPPTIEYIQFCKVESFKSSTTTESQVGLVCFELSCDFD